jgi:hypothetical protein
MLRKSVFGSILNFSDSCLTQVGILIYKMILNRQHRNQQSNLKVSFYNRINLDYLQNQLTFSIKFLYHQSK